MTDSMTDSMTGDLGQWEYQRAWTDLEVRSPNTYASRGLVEVDVAPSPGSDS